MKEGASACCSAHCLAGQGCHVRRSHTAVALQVQDFMMQGGHGWNKDVLALPDCEAQLSPTGLLVW